MAKAGASLKNVDRVLRKVMSAADLSSQVARRELYQIAEEVMASSKEDFVPVDTGALRSTGQVAVKENTPTNFKVDLTYGGPSVSYAIIVHENLNAHHPVGQAKYLSKPLAKAISNIPRRIVAAVNRANRSK